MGGSVKVMRCGAKGCPPPPVPVARVAQPEVTAAAPRVCIPLEGARLDYSPGSVVTRWVHGTETYTFQISAALTQSYYRGGVAAADGYSRAEKTLPAPPPVTPWSSASDREAHERAETRNTMIKNALSRREVIEAVHSLGVVNGAHVIVEVKTTLGNESVSGPFIYANATGCP